MENRRAYLTLNWIFFIPVPSLCHQGVGSEESEINEPQIFLFLHEEFTCIIKNNVPSQRCRETITSDRQIFQSDNMRISIIIISNKYKNVFCPFFLNVSVTELLHRGRPLFS